MFTNSAKYLHQKLFDEVLRNTSARESAKGCVSFSSAMSSATWELAGTNTKFAPSAMQIVAGWLHHHLSGCCSAVCWQSSEELGCFAQAAEMVLHQLVLS